MNHFFALALPPDVQQFVAGVSAEWRRMLPPDVQSRWYAPEDCHITLKFLGNVPEDRQDELSAAAMPILDAAEPFTVCLAACGGFPNLGRPFVLWIGVQSNQALTQLAGEIDRSMAGQGFPLERRRYVPHITLARVRPGRRSGPLPTPSTGEHAFPIFSAAAFALMQTLPPDRRPNGSKRRYNTVHTFPFHHTHSSAPGT